MSRRRPRCRRSPTTKRQATPYSHGRCAHKARRCRSRLTNRSEPERRPSSSSRADGPEGWRMCAPQRSEALKRSAPPAAPPIHSWPCCCRSVSPSLGVAGAAGAAPGRLLPVSHGAPSSSSAEIPAATAQPARIESAAAPAADAEQQAGASSDSLRGATWPRAGCPDGIRRPDVSPSESESSTTSIGR